MCLRYRKEEIHTFVVINYWYHSSVQSSGTTFVSALRFGEKFRDNNFRRKFCDLAICLCGVRVRTAICFLLNARNGEKLKKRLDWNEGQARCSTHVADSEAAIHPVRVLLLTQHLHCDIPIGNRIFCERPVMVTFHLKQSQTQAHLCF